MLALRNAEIEELRGKLKYFEEKVKHLEERTARDPSEDYLERIADALESSPPTSRMRRAWRIRSGASGRPWKPSRVYPTPIRILASQRQGTVLLP